MNIKAKNIFFACLAAIFVLSVCEGISYLIWRHYWSTRLTYRYYLQIMRSVNNYEFNHILGMASPIPGTTIFQVTEEYVDQYQVKEIAGFGVFDDGINPDKEKVILALGDSFTRGEGSLDNLSYGWVEIVENKLKNTDIVNLGYLGSGQIQQIRSYHRIKDKLRHDMVMLNFFGQGDFYDNIKKHYDGNNFIEDLPRDADKDAYLRKLLTAMNYRISLEYITKFHPRSYSVWLLLKVYEKFVSRFPPGSDLDKFYNALLRTIQERNERFIPAKLSKLLPDKWGCEELPDARFAFCYEPRYYRVQDQSIAERLAKYSADIINAFYRQLKDENKDFLLIFHPSKEEVYLYNHKDSSYDFDFMRLKFESYLDKDMAVFDLVPGMRKRASQINDPFFYRENGHYTQAGYSAVAELIYEYLTLNKMQRRN